MRTWVGLSLSAFALCTSQLHSQTMKIEDREPKSVRDDFARLMEVMSDLPGTGAYPAIKRVDPEFPDHVIYRPADLGRLGGRKLGILLWGNGGCGHDGASGRNHLLEVASHGYLAIAPGAVWSGPGSPPPEMRPKTPEFNQTSRPPPETVWQNVQAGLDMAEKANKDSKSPYYQRLDTSKVAVGGHSCGGLQALNVTLNDNRIKTVILHNSGIFNNPSFPIDGGLNKSSLGKITVPALYVLGGPLDIAYENGMDDYEHLKRAPAMVANIARGHLGTFGDPNGGAVAQVTVDWLDWQLWGNKRAGERFVGAKCILCSDPEWKILKKGM